MLKSKKPKPRDLEQIIGVTMTLFNGLNSQSKEMFCPEDRTIFLSHLALLCQNEAKLIGSPISDIIKGGESDEEA